MAFGASLIYMQRSGHEILRIDLRKMIFDRLLFSQSMKIGLPSAVQQTLVAMGFLALQWIVNGFGTDAYAAYTAAGRLDAFAGMPAMNFSLAASLTHCPTSALGASMFSLPGPARSSL